jgi:hypothetical protein
LCHCHCFPKKLLINWVHELIIRTVGGLSSRERMIDFQKIYIFLLNFDVERSSTPVLPLSFCPKRKEKKKKKEKRKELKSGLTLILLLFFVE